MAQAYALARQAGFDPASAVIAAAVGMAESGLNTGARGDVGLQTDYWGPSVGLMQIRTVKSQTGTGGDRDISRVNDPLQNMIAAYDISHKGKDFSAWTTYNNGAFRQFLGQSGAAAGTGGATAATGASWLGALTPDSLGEKVKGIALILLAVAGGGALVVLGGYKAVGSPKPPKALAAALL
jgi:hypothetical protein